MLTEESEVQKRTFLMAVAFLDPVFAAAATTTATATTTAAAAAHG